MRCDEVRALGELVGTGATAIADQARDLHVGIADRVFGTLGPVSRPVRLVHDPISATAHASARILTGAIVSSIGEAAGQTRPADAPSIHGSRRGRMVVGAINGAWGDRLQRDGSVLATPLELLDENGEPVTAGPGPLAAGRIAVFVHGLGETDRSWRSHGPGAYGPALSAVGVTPLYVRYNTGRAIADSGLELAAALEALEARLPEAARLALVGHSMGGLVIARACQAGEQTGPTRPGWRGRLTAVVTLGTPYAGAPLARAADRAERALSRLAETRAFVGPLRARSAGIRDLSHGSELPFPPGVDHYFVSAALGQDETALAGRLFGDLLVHRRSAWAQHTRTQRLHFNPDHYRHVGGASHFELLGHPAIADQLARWLAAPQLEPPRRPSPSRRVVQRP